MTTDKANLESVVAAPMAQAASGYQRSTTFTFTGNTLPSGLQISTYTVGASGGYKARQFAEKNAVVAGGYLNLTVPGGQTGNTISCGQITTTFNVLHASVKTYAILTNT